MKHDLIKSFLVFCFACAFVAGCSTKEEGLDVGIPKAPEPDGQGEAKASAPQVTEDFLFLFLNVGIPYNQFTALPQIKLAEEAGIMKFTYYGSGIPVNADPTTEQWKRPDALAELFTATDPHALITPRIPLMTNVGDAGLGEDSAAVYKKGPSRLLAWTDPRVQEAAAKAVRSVVSHYEASPFADQIWGYHISARETGEWIPEYRANGPDYSKPNTEAFRAWLSSRYSSDAALQEAWHRDDVTLATAAVPEDKEGRFPVGATPEGEAIQVFYHLPEEQDWVDYSQFISDNNAGCIRHLSAVAKEASGGKRAIMTFYGYVFELPSSICGHLRARDLLRDKNIDYVAAPISYQPYTQRLEGGTGAPMSAVDSYPIHGKTWINEDDLHTHVLTEGAKRPDWYWDIRNPQFRLPPDLAATTGILKRNLAFAAFRHASTWWMDLYGGGWYTDPGIWKVWDSDFGRSMREIRGMALPYHPEVAVIVDEESRFYEKLTYSGFREMYAWARNALQGSGATVGFYYLDDYLEGAVPRSAATVFLNAWHLDEARLVKLKQQMADRGGVVIWQYAPGFMNPGQGGAEAIEEVTGIKVAVDEGVSGSTASEKLGAGKFGLGRQLVPRIKIEDEAAETLAVYDSDGAVSAAVKKEGNVTQVLMADVNWSAGLLHSLFEAVGVPAMVSAPSVVQAGPGAVYVYATDDGILEVRAPKGRVFEDGSRANTLDLKKNESQLLGLKKE